jgi:hypothetical protein
MALTQGTKVLRRGPPSPGSFGYQVAPGEQVWRGSIVALNSAGYLQRVQTAGSIVVVGLCSRDYNNTASAAPSPDYVQVERGWWNLAPAGATAANVGQNVYATDDATVTLTPSAAGVARAGNTGNGTIGAVTVTGASNPSIGDYIATFTSATAFTVTDPRGETIGSGTAGTAFSAGGLGFTITSGGTAFAAGDEFIISVGALLVGTLAGFDKGVPYVRIQGS